VSMSFRTVQPLEIPRPYPRPQESRPAQARPSRLSSRGAIGSRPKASRAMASPCPVNTNCCGVGRSKHPESRRRSSVRPWLATTADPAVLTCPRGSSRLPVPKPPCEGPHVCPAANPGTSGLRTSLETGGTPETPQSDSSPPVRISPAGRPDDTSCRAGPAQTPVP